MTKYKKYLMLPLVFVFCALTLFFCLVPKHSAKADVIDTYYSFEGSNVTLPFANFLANDSNFKKGVSNIALKFDYNKIRSCYRVTFLTSSLLFSQNNSLYFDYVGGLGYATDDYDNASLSVNLPDIRLISSSELGLVESAICVQGYAPSDNFNKSLRAYFITNNRSFVPDIYKIQLGSRTTTSNSVYNYVRYYDKNDFFVEFGVYAGQWGSGVSIRLDTRTYYLADDDSNDYQFGFDKGYNEGLKDGSDSAINDNKDKWIKYGEDIGYAKGVAEAGDYTFMSLMSSVIDAPLQVFGKMFEFDILGVNMKTFYLSLFTACIIIFILRKVL